MTLSARQVREFQRGVDLRYLPTWTPTGRTFHPEFVAPSRLMAHWAK